MYKPPEILEAFFVSDSDLERYVHLCYLSNLSTNFYV